MIDFLIDATDSVLERNQLLPWCHRCESAMVFDALGKLWCPYCAAVCESCEISLRMYEEDRGKVQGDTCSRCSGEDDGYERDMQISWDNDRAASMGVRL